MNPIARMMKRYIKTPLKYALPLLFIGALVLVSTTGCTSTDHSSSLSNGSSYQNSNPTATVAAGGADKSQMLTNSFSKEFVIVTPFAKTVGQNGAVVYKAVIKDKPDKLNQYNKNIAIEVTVNAAQTKQRFEQLKTEWTAKGFSDDMKWDEQWYGQPAGTNSLAFDKVNERVYLSEQEPDSIGIYTGYGIYPYTLGEFNVITSHDTKSI
jgi:hypothetical protein